MANARNVRLYKITLVHFDNLYNIKVFSKLLKIETAFLFKSEIFPELGANPERTCNLTLATRSKCSSCLFPSKVTMM